MGTTGARDDLIDRVHQVARVNDMFTGQTLATVFENNSPLWPGSVTWAAVEAGAITDNGVRRLEEYRYIPADGSRDGLPVAFMFERQADGETEVRVYSDHHLVADRAPILPVLEDIHPWQGEDDVLFAYFSALKGNRLEEVLDLFDAEGYFRHSNGEFFRGRERLRQDFSMMMGKTGIRVSYCGFTDDGITCAAEVYMPSGRPAVAVYERSPTPGRLRAVRIYL